MANTEIDSDLIEVERWVDERLTALTDSERWVPNTGSALSRLKEKDRTCRIVIRRWIWTTVLASAAGAALLVIPASRACAEEPGPCALRVWKSFGSREGQPAPRLSMQNEAGGVSAVPLPESVQPVMTASEKSVRPTTARPNDSAPNIPEVAPVISRNFKESGNASAAVGIEIYLDYECPPCENFYRDVVSRLDEQYVRTGKIRLLYRDYPLPVHKFATLAARYADAAGEVGYYNVARTQIFRTQQKWREDGDLDTQVALVLPSEVMEQVRSRVKSDVVLDESLTADAAAGQADHLRYTPFVLLVHNGERDVIAGNPLSFEILKNRLDGLLEK